MTDVVGRLRAGLQSGPNTARTPWGMTIEEAADEIVRLRASLDECVAYMVSPVRMTNDADEANRRGAILDRARAALSLNIHHCTEPK